jgi:hypothetical protein
MAISSFMKLSMKFVIPSTFLISFSLSENAVMYPVSLTEVLHHVTYHGRSCASIWLRSPIQIHLADVPFRSDCDATRGDQRKWGGSSN